MLAVVSDYKLPYVNRQTTSNNRVFELKLVYNRSENE